MSNRCDHGMMSWECSECAPKTSWNKEEIDELLREQRINCQKEYATRTYPSPKFDNEIDEAILNAPSPLETKR